MKIIPLTQGQVVFVDDSDFPELSKFNWHLARGTRTNYAVRGIRRSGKMKRIYLHRQLLKAPPGIQVDHKDQNGLNCQRENLRLATRNQNGQNTSKLLGRTSRFKGVSKSKWGWKSGIRVSGKLFHLGYFRSEIEAAKAYDLASKKYFGQFSAPNFA
jgi:hypothetical protein